MNVGFDLSRVIIEGLAKHEPDFINNGNIYLPGALSSLSEIAANYGPGNVYVISRAESPDQERLMREWLRKHSFHSSTAIPEANVLLCSNRNLKVELCQCFNIESFVDDRLEILGPMVGKVERLYLFQSRQHEIDRFPQYKRHLRRQIVRVSDWDELAERLRPAGRYEDLSAA